MVDIDTRIKRVSFLCKFTNIVGIILAMATIFYYNNIFCATLCIIFSFVFYNYSNTCFGNKILLELLKEMKK
jgi:hypothetical protein